MAQLLEEGADHKLYLSCVGIVAVVAARNEGLPIINHDVVRYYAPELGTRKDGQQFPACPAWWLELTKPKH